nr:MAG TPA: hypothetical protein [Caudoviricetes sp.]
MRGSIALPLLFWHKLCTSMSYYNIARWKLLIHLHPLSYVL